MPLPRRRLEKLAAQVTTRLPPTPFAVTRAGSEPFTVLAYVKASRLQNWDEERRYKPGQATLTLPLGQPVLQNDDELAGYVVTETLPCVGWLKYGADRLPVLQADADTQTFVLLLPRVEDSVTGGQFRVWEATQTFYDATVREVDDDEAMSGGVGKRDRVLELTFRGRVELDPGRHRLRSDGLDYAVVEGKAHESYSLAKVQELTRE